MYRKARGLKYELVPCAWLKDKEIGLYREEFEQNGEKESVMAEAREIARAAMEKKIPDQNESLYWAFMVDDRLTGACRITKEAGIQSTGRMEFSIRPAERGKGYGRIFLLTIAEAGRRYGLDNMTAYVDEDDKKASRVLESAGWRWTGGTFDNGEGPEPRRCIEYVL